MFSGIVNSNAVNAAQKLPSFAESLTRVQPNGASPLFLILSQLAKKTAKQVTHGYWTETLPNVSMTLNAAVADGVATTFTVVSTTDVIPGQLYRAMTTGEVVQVLTVPNGTSITVTRGVGNIAAAAIANSVVLQLVGTAYEEGSGRPTPQRIQQSLVQNYTQIFRNAWAVSGTTQAEQFFKEAGGNPLAKDKVDGALLHMLDIERALLWGQKFSGTKNGMPLHTMDGIESSVRVGTSGANIQTLGATTTFDQLETAIDITQTTVTAGSTQDRLMFCGNTAYKVIQGIGRKSGQYQLIEGATQFGLRFDTFKTSLGTYHLIIHPLLNANATLSKMSFVVDPSSINLAYLEGRDTQHKYFGANGELSTDNSLDATGGVYTTELTLELTNPFAHALITNFTAAA